MLIGADKREDDDGSETGCVDIGRIRGWEVLMEAPIERKKRASMLVCIVYISLIVTPYVHLFRDQRKSISPK